MKKKHINQTTKPSLKFNPESNHLKPMVAAPQNASPFKNAKPQTLRPKNGVSNAENKKSPFRTGIPIIETKKSPEEVRNGCKSPSPGKHNPLLHHQNDVSKPNPTASELKPSSNTSPNTSHSISSNTCLSSSKCNSNNSNINRSNNHNISRVYHQELRDIEQLLYGSRESRIAHNRHRELLIVR